MKTLLTWITFLILISGCSVPVAVPKDAVLTEPSLKSYSIKPYHGEVAFQPLLKKVLTMPMEGEKNSYDITVTKELALAYETYLGGDGEAALKALDQAMSTSKDAKFLWQIAFLKTKIYMMMGLAADALESVKEAERQEIAYAQTNLNSRSLRGEVKIWLEDYEGAKADFYQVLAAVGDWELPTSYGMPPANMTQLVNTATAQLRALTGLAAIFTMNRDYTQGLFYAQEAEKRYNSIHYVANHGLYGMFLNLHLDSYYGRAMNLTFLASALTSLKQEPDRAEKAFKDALDFFNAMGYKKGEATVLALKARALNISGQYNKCNTAGKKALEVSLQSGMIDFVWRIEALRGDTFEKLGYKDEAKKAYRRAFDTLNIISGMLHSDTSKRTFGVGKASITRKLIAYDLADKDYAQLFEDLERSRARAFIDQLAKRTINVHNDPDLREIQKLDAAIAKQMLLNTNPKADQSVKAKLLTLIETRKQKAETLSAKDPQLALVVAIWSSSLKAVQKRLSKDSALLYFLPTLEDEKLTYLLIEPDRVSIKEMAITQKILKEKVTHLAGRIQEHITRGLKRQKNTAVQSPQDQNWQALFSFKDLKAKALYIVADQALHYMPWGIVTDAKEIAVLPNGSWLNINQKTVQTQTKVIVGDPNFGVVLPQLKGAKAEAQAIAKLYHTKALLGDEATIEAVYHKLDQGGALLHLATHAIFYEERPLDSSLFLSHDHKAAPLSAQMLFEKPLSAKLVVLSACQTGLGKRMEDSDMLGLERSFYLGGSRAILSSLWEVDDQGTQAFMRVFHHYAQNGNYAKGWYEAKERLKKEGYAQAVYGAFVLHGAAREF